ncbi:OsmC family peroxiredoxin [Nocardioides albidus]|uniref:OsmC family peroxiredoxin n=1 Tax=Nocardioides albidus TaxID=1517589 RepID=A0A5C4VN53_9ACTN|nr:OsmC family protein [Nocardioides albidus]TNM37324.1 OsmC family peroxiredoxin [Nocardioides albidus]
MADPFEVRVSAGSLRADDTAGWVVPHAWTERGIVVEAPGTGAHLLHAAVAVCVLNDVVREARSLDLVVHGVAVTAEGGFDEHWTSTGISYRVAIDSAEDAAAVSALIERVDEVAEIPRAVRAGADVRRVAG